MVYVPVSWRCCWAWGPPRCSASVASSPVTVMESIAAKAATGTSSNASASRVANGSCSPATSPKLRRYLQGKSCPYWRIAGSTSVWSAASNGFCSPWPSSPARSATATTGAKVSATAQEVMPKPGVKLGHHLSAHPRSWGVAVPLSRDRRVEPQGGRLGRCRTCGSSHRNGSWEHSLHPRADPHVTKAATDPACRQRQRHACGHA
jgi:hypothetical protein